MNLPDLIAQTRTILEYPGYKGALSRCWLVCHAPVCLVGDLPDNPGTGIHDAIEIIATRIVETFAIDPADLLLIAAGSDSAGQGSYARISLTPGDNFMHIQRVKFIGASFERIEPQAVAMLLGLNDGGSGD